MNSTSKHLLAGLFGLSLLGGVATAGTILTCEDVVGGADCEGEILHDTGTRKVKIKPGQFIIVGDDDSWEPSRKGGKWVAS